MHTISSPLPLFGQESLPRGINAGVGKKEVIMFTARVRVRNTTQTYFWHYNRPTLEIISWRYHWQLIGLSNSLFCTTGEL
jgi:hypothetical protein